MSTPEGNMTQAERSIGAGIGMLMMAGVIAYQGAEVPQYRLTAYIFVPAWVGLAAVNFRHAATIVQREQAQRLPFDDVPALGVVELEKQIGLAA